MAMRGNLKGGMGGRGGRDWEGVGGEGLSHQEDWAAAKSCGSLCLLL